MMNKAALIDSVVEKTGINRKTVEQVVDALLDTIVETMQLGESVNLTGFGKFSPRVRSARLGVDPQNPGQKIQVPSVVVPKFKSGKALKDALKHSIVAPAPQPATKTDTLTDSPHKADE